MTTSVTLVTNQLDKVGGLEHYVDELATRLVPRGFDVTIIAKRSTPGPKEAVTRTDGVTVVRTWVPSKGRPWFALSYGIGVPYVSRREIRALGQSRVLHGHFFAPMLGPALERSDYIYTFHGPVYKELLDERQGSYALPSRAQRLAVELTKQAERKVIGNARMVTVLSSFMTKEIEELGARPQRVAVLPGGIDTARFSPGRHVPPDRTQGCHPLLFVARRLATGKGVMELVDAMPEIRRAYPAALLVVAGSGALAESIERRITTLGLGQAVRLVGDVHGAELVNWIRSADLCVVPTQRPEPFGLATVEALACGTPVVATPSGASPELLEPLDPRLVLPGLRPADIARGIDGVLADSDLISTVRAKARAHVVPRFGWDRIADAWAEIYTEFEAS